MKALVVGYGSIGQRHARLVTELGCETAVVSSHANDYAHRFPTLDHALREWAPEYVVIANQTSDHYASFSQLGDASFTGRVLVEKPLFDDIRPLPAAMFSHAAVAYNLRYHPLVIALADALRDATITEATLHVGQWLPDWRPGRDYRLSYSAKRSGGGGVLRDLSHELDLALHLFGSWTSLTATGGKFSDLEIETEDTFAIVLASERCPSVTVTMNYIDKPARRQITATTTRGRFVADFMAGTLTKDDVVIRQETVHRDHTYLAQHRAMLDGKSDTLCSLREGLAVVELIAAAEQANATHTKVAAA